MKYLLTLFIPLCFYSLCIAQNGIGLFEDKVGIGIDNPVNQLDMFNESGASTLSLSTANQSSFSLFTMFTSRPDISKTLSGSSAGSGNKGWGFFG